MCYRKDEEQMKGRGGDFHNLLLWRVLSPPKPTLPQFSDKTCSSCCAAAPAITFGHHPIFLTPLVWQILFVELLLSELDCSLQSCS
jgi:hypothetical protein